MYPLNAPGSDAELAQKARRNPAAFAELYRRHVRAVYCYHLARTGLPAEAEDLTAETFFAALKGLASYRSEGSFAAWLFGIARNKLAQHYRSVAPWSPLEAIENEPDPAPDPDTLASEHLQLDQVTQALRALAPDRAEAITLVYFAGMNAREAGKTLGKSEDAVKMLVSRGLSDLRQRFAARSQEEV
jgi:RNA polymerase sigma-70 factor (ECF subfamily)